MDPTVRNLQLQWHDRLPEPALEDVGEMAGGLPFEKQREEVLRLDREAIARTVYEMDHSHRQYLTAHFGEELVGAVALTALGESTDNPSFCLLEHELIQRNRDDIRGRLLDTMGEAYPDAILHQQAPAQNRTARQYLQRHDSVDVKSTDTILQLHWPIEDQVPEPADAPGVLDLENGVNTSTGKMIADDPAAREVLEVTSHGSIHSRFLSTGGDVTSRQLIAVDLEESNPTLDQLLNTIHDWATDQSIDHLEWPVTESFLEEHPSFTGPMEIVNKRVQHRFQLA